jgi:transcriptional regulator with XRE-family HTH domain
MKKARPDNIDRLVSKQLRTRRLFLGLTQQDIGKELGVSIQQVQKYEKATNRISCGKLHTLALFLKTPITYFYEDSIQSSIISNAAIEDEGNFNEKELLTLVKAFQEIKSLEKRKRVVQLIKLAS